MCVAVCICACVVVVAIVVEEKEAAYVYRRSVLYEDMHAEMRMVCVCIGRREDE